MVAVGCMSICISVGGMDAGETMTSSNRFMWHLAGAKEWTEYRPVFWGQNAWYYGDGTPYGNGIGGTTVQMIETKTTTSVEYIVTYITTAGCNYRYA